MTESDAAPRWRELAALYRAELFDRVLPFWLEHAPDHRYGGYFTCLDRAGRVFDTDKFVWLQCRQVWLFAMLCNKVEKRQEWLDHALLGAEFLRRHGHDGQGDWYFSLTRDGRPLVQPYNIFANTFAAIAFAQLNLATGDPAHAAIARQAYRRVLERRDNPKGRYEKAVAGTRPLRGFSLPMILSNVAIEMEHLLGAEGVRAAGGQAIHEILEVFCHPEHGLILENVAPDGAFVDCFEGRLLNPGHAIEAMWFLLDLAVKLERPDVARRAVAITLRTLERAWDAQHGGIYYFLDVLGRPPQQLEWDQKLWWVHIETLIALLKGYRLTGDPACRQWFERVHAYTWEHFRDPEFPEWYGYLNRRGEVLLPLKGGKWKGCFHVPRGLYQCWRTMGEMADG
jgi:N-acylglucosamine 2-epimerase